MVRARTGIGFLVGYLLLCIFAAVYLDEPVRLTGFLYIFANLVISVAWFCLFNFRPDWPFHLLIYSVYFLVYVSKGIVQYGTGLNTNYTYMTLKTTIGREAYLDSLAVVTLGHLVLAAFLVVAGILAERKPVNLKAKAYLSGDSIRFLGNTILIWVLVSSVVMYMFGVAVMGTKGVSLPFKLSGVLYFSRTMIIPLLLLYFLEKALARGDQALFRRSVLLFMILAMSEVFVRASKSPLFFLILQVLFLYGLLLGNGERPTIRFKKRNILFMFVFALALWPVVEVYRTMVVDNSVSAEMMTEVADYVGGSEKNYLVFAVERLFQRLAGFLQLSGIVADAGFNHDLANVFRFDTIGRYYTQYYLGYTQEGHLSSPSILGSAIILGGRTYWPLVFCGYLVLMLFIWRATFLFRHMALPIACFLCVEVFNTLLAGTIDSSLKSIALVFAMGVSTEIVFAAAATLNPRKAGLNIAVTASQPGAKP